MKRIVSLCLAVFMLLTMSVPVLAQEDKYAVREYVIQEFVQCVGASNLEKSEYPLLVFGDADEIDPMYYDAFERAVSTGLIKGYEDYTLRPKDKITRTEAFVILSRCIPDGEKVADAIEFSDMKPWAKNDIDKLTRMGIVKGYGNGLLGSDDFITKEQVKILTDRADAILNTEKPESDFYNYVNNKTFRNVIWDSNNKGVIKTEYGMVWSNAYELAETIEMQKSDMLQKLMNGELKYEDNSAAQRVHDMLVSIFEGQEVKNSDREIILSLREKIQGADTIEEFLSVVCDIYVENGINVMFDVASYTDSEKGVTYPYFDFKSAGSGGLMAFRENMNTEEYVSIYQELLSKYFKSCNIEFETKDVKKAIELQAKCGVNTNYLADYLYGLSLKLSFNPNYSEDEYIEDYTNLSVEHSKWVTDNGELVNPKLSMKLYSHDETRNVIEGLDIGAYIEKCGYGFKENIKMPDENVMECYKNILIEENLAALKINALLNLVGELQFNLSEEENETFTKLDYFAMGIMCMMSPEHIKAGLSNIEEIDAMLAEILGNTDESVTSSANILLLNTLLPKDMGILWSEYNYDEDKTANVEKMVRDICDEYKKWIGESSHLSAQSKENAIKKLDDMYIIIGYSKDYPFPKITSVEDGGSYVSNYLNVMSTQREIEIRCCNEAEFIKRMLFDSPDTVNATYYPEWNVVNVPAAFLEHPAYDADGSYASQLGSVGIVIAHEIGHAFLRSEDGVPQWLADEDKAYYEEVEKSFIEYFSEYKLQNGAIQDSQLTLAENMADFSGLMTVLRIVDDNKDRKELLESYAKFWAMAYEDKYIDFAINDVHSDNSVRVNANVSSMDCFYEIYDIDKSGEMYVEKDKRLKIW